MYSMYGGDIITMLILGILVFVIPGTLTVWNIYNCIAEKPKLEKVISTLTVFIGGVFIWVCLLLTMNRVVNGMYRLMTCSIITVFQLSIAVLYGLFCWDLSDISFCCT